MQTNSPSNWLANETEEPFFTTPDGGFYPTTTEHPFCDDPTCEYCNDDAYYTIQENAKQAQI